MIKWGYLFWRVGNYYLESIQKSIFTIHLFFMKIVVFLFLITLVFVSCKQENRSLDCLFYEVKGPVETITEIEEMPVYPDQLSKNVYYFNKQGELTKAEHFRSTDTSGTFDLEYITHVKQAEDGRRNYYKTAPGSEKIYEVFQLEKVSDDEIRYAFKIEERDVEVNRTIYYNNELPVRSYTTGHYADSKFETKKENFYTNQGILDSSITIDLITKRTATAYYKNNQEDNFGNFTSGEFVDENGERIYTIKRSYTYYK